MALALVMSMPFQGMARSYTEEKAATPLKAEAHKKEGLKKEGEAKKIAPVGELTKAPRHKMEVKRVLTTPKGEQIKIHKQVTPVGEHGGFHIKKEVKRGHKMAHKEAPKAVLEKTGAAGLTSEHAMKHEGAAKLSKPLAGAAVAATTVKRSERPIGFHGTVASVTGNKVILSSKSGEGRHLIIGKETKLLRAGLPAGTAAIVPGEMIRGSYWKNANGVLEAKTIKIGPPTVAEKQLMEKAKESKKQHKELKREASKQQKELKHEAKKQHKEMKHEASKQAH